MINVRDFRVDRNSTSTAPVNVIERTNGNNQKNPARHPHPPLLWLIFLLSLSHATCPCDS